MFITFSSIRDYICREEACYLQQHARLCWSFVVIKSIQGLIHFPRKKVKEIFFVQSKSRECWWMRSPIWSRRNLGSFLKPCHCWIDKKQNSIDDNCSTDLNLHFEHWGSWLSPRHGRFHVQELLPIFSAPRAEAMAQQNLSQPKVRGSISPEYVPLSPRFEASNTGDTSSGEEPTRSHSPLFSHVAQDTQGESRWDDGVLRSEKRRRKEGELRVFCCSPSLSDKESNHQIITVMEVAINVVKVRSEVCGLNWLVSGGWGTSL